MFKEGGTARGGFKLRGEWAELLFMTRAAEHGLRVISPGETAAATTSWSKPVGVFSACK